MQNDEFYNDPDFSPEKEHIQKEYVRLKNGTFINPRKELFKMRVEGNKLLSGLIKANHQYCCCHSDRGDESAYCSVGHRPVCSREGCLFYCSKCRLAVCRTHVTFDENGLPVCDNCAPGQYELLIFIILVILVFAVYFFLF